MAVDDLIKQASIAALLRRSWSKAAPLRSRLSAQAKPLQQKAQAGFSAARSGLRSKHKLVKEHYKRLSPEAQQHALAFASGAIPGVASELISDDPSMARALKSGLIWGGGGVLAKKLLV